MPKLFGNMKILDVIKKKPVYKIMWVNFKTLECRSMIIQLTFESPWLIPHYDPHFGEADIPLAGWLFFYIGVYTEGIIYPGDDNAKIIGPDGKKHYFYRMTRDEGDNYHQRIKNGERFEAFPFYSNDGKSLTLQLMEK